VKIVPVGGLTGTIDLGASKLTDHDSSRSRSPTCTWTRLPGSISSRRVAAPTCARPLTLTNTTPVDLFKPITMVGTYTIPPFTRCGVLTPLLVPAPVRTQQRDDAHLQ
jgi:hypothetical protein